MTIYTFFLLIMLIAAVLWLSLGYGHSKLRKEKVTHPLAWYVQYFTGTLLIFSGMVKAVDPMGTGYKMKDYFQEFGNQGLPLMDFFKSYSLTFAVTMIVFELVIGIALIFGVGGKKTLMGNLLMMIFFLVLTGFNYLTGFTPKGATPAEDIGIFQFGQWAAFDKNNIRISDCGCFGDFMKLSPLETFLKDIFLTGISIYIYSVAYKLKELLPAPQKIRAPFIGFITASSLFFCLMNFYFNEPMIDFRPFYEGVDLVKAKADCMANAPKVEIHFVYKNKQTGKTEEFLATNLPKDLAENWEYVNRRDKEISEGCKSKVTELTQFPEIDDYTQFPELAKSDGYSLLVISSHPEEGNKSAFERISKIAKEAHDAKGIPAYGLYYYIKDQNGNGQDDELEKFRHDHQLPVDFRFGDEKLVLTISRANPGLLLMHKGKIVKKFHHRHIPADLATLSEYMK